MTHRSVLLDIAQGMTNRLLRLDSNTLAALQQINGRIIRLCLIRPDIDVCIIPCPEGLELSPYTEGSTDVSLEGNWRSFIGMTRAYVGQEFVSVDMRIHGDVGLAQYFTKCCRQLDIDWEDALSHYIGDYPAHKLGNLQREIEHRWPNHKTKMVSQLRKLFQEELLSGESLGQFAAELTDLDTRVQQVEQRLKRLAEYVKTST